MSRTEFKVGDRVRRTNDFNAYESKDSVFTGQEFTIAGIGKTDQGLILEGKDPSFTYSRYAFELIEPEPVKRAKVGDKVRLTGSLWPEVGLQIGSEVEIEFVGEERGYGFYRIASPSHAYGTGYRVNLGPEFGEAYLSFNQWGGELLPTPEPEPEKPREFQVGDTVRLHGRNWGGGYRNAPEAGTVHEIVHVGRFAEIQVDGRTWELVPPHHPQYSSYGADLVTIDSTGYPEGTPRAEKVTPDTQQVKEAYSGGDPKVLAEFNRWYERELREVAAETAEAAAQGAYEKGLRDGEAIGRMLAKAAAQEPTATEFVTGLTVGTRIRSKRHGTEYTRIPQGLIVTKSTDSARQAWVGRIYSLQNVATGPNFYEVIE